MLRSLLCADSVQSSTEFEDRVIRMAGVLADTYDVGDRTRVVLKLENSAAFVTVLLALVHVGASTVLIDPDQRASETRSAAALTGAELAVVDSETVDLAGVVSVSGYELLAAAAQRVSCDEQFDLGAWAERPDALLTWSSGSTGEAKCVVKSGRGVLANLERTIERMGYRPDDVLFPLLPFSHQYGLSIVLIAVLAGTSLAVAPYRRLDRAVRTAARVGATVIDATPGIYHKLLTMAERRPGVAAELNRVRMYCTGGAPLDATVTEQFRARFGRPLLDGYGSTELGNIACATAENAAACGRVLPGIEVRVVGSARDVGAGAIGELHVRSPDRFTGYLGADGALEDVRADWYPTGDIGRIDPDGNLVVLGRRWAVHRSGYTLYPEVIERKASTCGAAVAVIPIPDPQLGHRLVFVVQDAGLAEATHWRRLICAALPPSEQPNRVLVIEQFPLTTNGKTDRRALTGLAVDPRAARPGPTRPDLRMTG